MRKRLLIALTSVGAFCILFCGVASASTQHVSALAAAQHTLSNTCPDPFNVPGNACEFTTAVVHKSSSSSSSSHVKIVVHSSFTANVHEYEQINHVVVGFNMMPNGLPSSQQHKCMWGDFAWSGWKTVDGKTVVTKNAKHGRTHACWDGHNWRQIGGGPGQWNCGNVVYMMHPPRRAIIVPRVVGFRSVASFNSTFEKWVHKQSSSTSTSGVTYTCAQQGFQVTYETTPPSCFHVIQVPPGASTFTASATASANATVNCPSGSSTATATASGSGSATATSTISQQDAQNKAQAQAQASAQANASANASASCHPAGTTTFTASASANASATASATVNCPSGSASATASATASASASGSATATSTISQQDAQNQAQAQANANAQAAANANAQASASSQASAKCSPAPPASHFTNVSCTGFEEIFGGESMIIKCDVSNDNGAPISLDAHSNDGNSRVSGINCYSQGGTPSCQGNGQFEFRVTGINGGSTVLFSSITVTASSNGVNKTWTSNPFPVDPS